MELARKVEAVLKQDRSILSINDPLMDQIVNHKKDLYTTFESELNESKSRSWDRIFEVIQNDLDKNTTPKTDINSFKITSIWKSTFLKVAAAVLFTVLLSVIYLQLDYNQSEIVAEAGSTQTTYTLSDESLVQLRPNSTLSVLEQSDAVVRYELKGEAFFNITKDVNRRFLIEAGTGIIEVTGTSFNIREWAGETVVYLQEGSLSLISSNNSGKVLLKPGETAKVNSNFEISEPFPTDGNEFTSWKKNEMIFNNRRVESIIKELEYHYSINIQVPEQLEDEVLGGTLSLESREVSLENLGIVLGGNFSSIGDDTYQFVE